MNSRSVSAIVFGALFAAGMNLPFSTEGQGGWQVAELGDATTHVAQQEQQRTPATPAKPAPAAQQSEGPGWAVNCKSAASETGLECRLSQTVVTQQRGQVLADVTFRIPADKKAPEAIVRLPLGILLSAGATLQVDDKPPQQLSFRTCDRNGCYAQTPVSTEMLATLQKGKQLQVSFKDLAEKSITVPLSLNGFSDAYAKI